jgi:hypothetical protein
MTVIVIAVGLFYILAAGLVLRRVRMEWFLDRAIEKLSGVPEPDRGRIYFMAASALIYGGAGFALVARSVWAVWLLGGGLLMQALYHTLLRQWIDPQLAQADAPGAKVWNATVLSSAAFALAAYALRLGVLA